MSRGFRLSHSVIAFFRNSAGATATAVGLAFFVYSISLFRKSIAVTK